MRTTLDIDDDVLAAVQDLARREGVSAGQVVSRILRAALANARTAGTGASATIGFRPFASRGIPVTNADIDRLRDAQT